MDIVQKSTLKRLAKLKCETRAEAMNLYTLVRLFIVAELGFTGRMVNQCNYCQSPETFKDSSISEFIEPTEGSCLFRSSNPVCLRKAEKEYLNFMASHGVAIDKMFRLLKTNSILSFNTTEQISKVSTYD